MFASSIEYIRRNHFEVFYYSHVLFLVIAIVFTCWHYPTCLAFCVPPVSLWLADRAVRFYKSWFIKSSFVSVQQVVPPTATQDGIVQISFQNRLLDHFKPWQYLFAAIVSNKRRLWEYMNWHHLQSPRYLKHFKRQANQKSKMWVSPERQVKRLACYNCSRLHILLTPLV